MRISVLFFEHCLYKQRFDVPDLRCYPQPQGSAGPLLA